jgi:hypothetical protein
LNRLLFAVDISLTVNSANADSDEASMPFEMPTPEAAGSRGGAVGVPGAPGGKAADDCARAGIAAIADSLEF